MTSPTAVVPTPPPARRTAEADQLEPRARPGRAAPAHHRLRRLAAAQARQQHRRVRRRASASAPRSCRCRSWSRRSCGSTGTSRSRPSISCSACCGARSSRPSRRCTRNTAMSHLFERWNLPDNLVAVLVAPVVEESMKALGPVLLIAVHDLEEAPYGQRNRRLDRVLRPVRDRLRVLREHPLPRRIRLRRGRRARRRGRRPDRPSSTIVPGPDPAVRLRASAVHVDDRDRRRRRDPVHGPDRSRSIAPFAGLARRDGPARLVEPDVDARRRPPGTADSCCTATSRSSCRSSWPCSAS